MDISFKEIFATHTFDDYQSKVSNEVRAKALNLAVIMDEINESAEKTLAIRKLEEAVMWSNKAIALRGVKHD